MTAPATQETQPQAEQLTGQQALDYLVASYDVFYDEPIPGVRARDGLLFVETDESRFVAKISSDSKYRTTRLWEEEAPNYRDPIGVMSRTARRGRKLETDFIPLAGNTISRSRKENDDLARQEIDDPEAWFVGKVGEIQSVIAEKLKRSSLATQQALEQRIKDVSKHTKGRRVGNASMAAFDLYVAARFIHDGETNIPHGTSTASRDVGAVAATIIAYRFGRAGLIRGNAAIRGKGAPNDVIHGERFGRTKKPSHPRIPDGLERK